MRPGEQHHFSIAVDRDLTGEYNAVIWNLDDPNVPELVDVQRYESGWTYYDVLHRVCIAIHRWSFKRG